ncbi:MAG: hypothetical protein AAF050_01985 [Cyanobacteria bacterium J06649_5]
MIPFVSAIPGVIASKATYHAVKSNGGSKEEALAAGAGAAVAVSAVMLDPIGGAAAHAVTHAASHAVSHAASHAVSHGTSHAVSHGTSHAVSHGASHGANHGVGHTANHASSSQASPRSVQDYGSPNYKDGQHVELLKKATYGDSSVPAGTKGVVSSHHFDSAGKVVDTVKVDKAFVHNQPPVDVIDSFVKVLTGKG